MANPTTNYGFLLPTPTDLVTDLPADFDVALQGVDTQMFTNANAATQKATLTTKGDIYGATGTATPARLAVGANNTVLTADSSTATGLKWATVFVPTITNATQYIATSQNTTSTSYTDLTTVGPTVTATTGTRALVMVGAAIRNTAAGVATRMSFAVSGATTLAASDDNAYNVSEVDFDRSSLAILVTGLTAGSNTFTAKYRTAAGTATFAERNIIVIDMGS